MVLLDLSNGQGRNRSAVSPIGSSFRGRRTGASHREKAAICEGRLSESWQESQSDPSRIGLRLICAVLLPSGRTAALRYHAR